MAYTAGTKRKQETERQASGHPGFLSAKTTSINEYTLPF